MAALKYSLEEFTPETLGATEKAWKKILDSSPGDFSHNVYERKLERAAKGCEYSTGSEFCYGIFKKGEKYASAITEISYTRKSSKWIKMLEMHLSPDLDLSVDKNQPNFSVLADIFAAAIFGTVKLTGVHTSRVIKLYARTTVLLSFFKFVAEALTGEMSKQNDFDIKVSVDGRWLVIKL